MGRSKPEISFICSNFAFRKQQRQSSGLSPAEIKNPQEESPGNTGQSPSETEVIREGKQTVEENNRPPQGW